jgi:hypothetical protein
VSRAAALKVEEVRSIARSHTVAMINVLVGVARQKKAPEMARVVAANSVLDRGWGRPDQHVASDASISVVIRQIIDIVDHSDEAKVIEHDDCNK